MTTSNATSHTLEFHVYDGTNDRPGSRGTYIVRLSKANQESLKVSNGDYLKVQFRNASVLACLSVDPNLEDDRILLDQTLRMAINLKGFLQSAEDKAPKVVEKHEPIIVQPSSFTGPNWLERVLKQQYLVCVIHYALSTDMEKPTIVRLAKSSIETLGIEPGDKVQLNSGYGCVTVRCLCLPDNDEATLPDEKMKKLREDWKKEDSDLPWVLMDLETRNLLNASGDKKNNLKPWDTIIVSRYLPHTFIAEFSTVAMGLALTALGGAVVLPNSLTDIYPWLPTLILSGSFFIVLVLIAFKIRDRI